MLSFHKMNTGLLFVAMAAVFVIHGPVLSQLQFEKITLSDVFVGEGVSVGDFNGDSLPDVAAGPFWWEGPGFTQRHRYGTGGQESYPVTSYSAYYMNMKPQDIDGDGLLDIIYQSGAGGQGYWHKNPGNNNGSWPRYAAHDFGGEATEFWPLFPGQSEKAIQIVNGRLGWGEPNASNPTGTWDFHPISQKSNYSVFTHGAGTGDINGDSRLDIITYDGWYEQPENTAGDPLWTFHPHSFGRGGAQMFAEDINGDGYMDVVTSLQAHGWGLSWFEQVRNNGEIDFIEHKIMETRQEEEVYGVAFSQLHSLGFADLDGDGLKDIVTGKRYYAHNGSDPEADSAAVLYWFKQVRENGTTRFVPYLIDDEAGSGCSLSTLDVNGDGNPDVITSSKKGTYVFLTSGFSTPVENSRQVMDGVPGSTIQSVHPSPETRESSTLNVLGAKKKMSAHSPEIRVVPENEKTKK